MPIGNGDAQVVAVEAISEPRSVLDTILSKIDLTSYDPANPFLLRLLVCGKKRSGSLDVAVKSAAEAAKRECDANNPFYDAQTDAQVGSLTIDYGECFVQLLEGPESYVFRVMEKMKAATAVDTGSLRILFIDDDIPKRTCSEMTLIDKVPPSTLAMGSVERNQEEIAELVFHDLSSVVELAEQSSTQAARMKGVFADNAKVNFPKLFPRVEVLTAYMKADCFFTLDEFISSFCKPANLVRDVEINHPAEDPLVF